MPHHDLKPTRVRIGIFVILWLIILMNYIDRATLSIALPYLSEDLNIAPDMQGWILSSFFWTYLIFQIPGGYLLDKLGARKVITFAALLWGLAQGCCAIVHSGIHLAALRLSLGTFEAPCAPSGAKLNSSWLPETERGRGATFIDMASSFGTAIGGVIVTSLIGIFGSWRWAFVVTSVFTLVLSLVFFLYVRDSPQQHPKTNQAEIDLVESNAVAQTEDKTESRNPGIIDYAASRSFWGLFIGRLSWALVWWGVISWTPSYMSAQLNFDLATLGWSTFVIYGMGVIGQLVAGSAADWGQKRFGRSISMKVIFTVSGIGVVASLYSLLAITNGYLAIVALSIAVFFINFGGLYWAIPAWLAPRAQVGIVGSVMNVASSAGGVIAPIVMGYVIKLSGGYASAFLFLTCCAAFYLVGSLFINFNRPLHRLTA